MDHRYEHLRIPFEMINLGATLTRVLMLLVRGLNNAVDFVDDNGPQSNLRGPHEDSEALQEAYWYNLACSSKIFYFCEKPIFSDSVCQVGNFGRECERYCNCADRQEACSISTGSCLSGCAPGYTGEDCWIREVTLCGEGWKLTPSLQTCVKAYKPEHWKTWHQARSICQQNGGDLVTIRDSDMANFTLGQYREQYCESCLNKQHVQDLPPCFYRALYMSPWDRSDCNGSTGLRRVDASALLILLIDSSSGVK
ncbi:hypothetical protein PoB_007502700 [Plakobranchus ocellatus]|uniref:C-type lectin domain-containing protein n=1 Tax=Plakobranchus ocellatus TaxID=259542 RepID=A0AAV4DW48_9GAST|nr:hypothetical protein PoB_007502700 [Plakobranchus ocellatus]